MSQTSKIAFGFSNCSDALFDRLIMKDNKYVLLTDQKYHRLLIQGLVNNGVTIHCYSGLPVNRNVTRKLYIHEKNDIELGVHYHYYKTLNIPILRQIMIFIEAFFSILFCKDVYNCLICDYMSIMNTYGMALAAKIRKIPVVEIVKDIPGLMNTSGEPVKGIYKRIANLADGFILLTKQMTDVVNIHDKPYIVLEGHVDAVLQELSRAEKWELVSGKKVIIYAGGIHKVFGIDKLVNGFIKASIDDSELRIFGDGDYRHELEEICKKYNNIRYMGVVKNTEIVNQEQKAALLVNPRPTDPIYTRFSFPSKNLEYMVSGTPVLTTNLPGMPDEYKKYVYLIENETVDGVAKAIRSVFADSFNERCDKAYLARQFVLENKSNNIQAKKILQFISNSIYNA